ncbi:arsenic resistance N-acetyltransferase ArsN2 [Maribacter sp. PR1]|uniref:Arsenic resistance N-acetyltransferase ArsN2 n=1 Tax=Maribacter cobaltidurans TaxID=1178778 RepID=A0ABU7IVA1_9FLAO|nr:MULTISPECIES: arsenic resistance N-acetyltransferase ArsN2 [Maribacter]MDC6389440.1 arsenic resistance N-acetyltransferase ArsN2 [Maribacter sp. PR1]MEE1976829.1 arsenic resistance N-acetyltransferase ArsN2 [Maribacter cobaltidurans]
MNRKTDLQKIQDLLKRNNLPYEDLQSSKVEFITKEAQDQLIGCIGIEQYDADGLLRSLAVADSYKGKGIGKELLSELCSACKKNGIQYLHLLTTTADRYFEHYGFTVAEKSNAPTTILKTKEFSEICPSSSVYMTLDI